MPFPWLPVAGLVSSLATQLFDRSKAGYQTSGGYRAFKDSVAHEQKIFERDSAYNSPAQQMERLREAGLNPNLMYGQGTPGNTSGSNVTSNPHIQSLNVIGPMLEAMMAGKEMQLKDAQIKSIEADTTLKGARTETEEWKIDRMRQDFEYLSQNYPELVKKLQMDNKFQGETYEFRKGRVESDMYLAQAKLTSELKKHGLMDQDGKLKAEVLTSKQFQSKLLEIQKRFLDDGDMNPQMFWQMMATLFVNALK